MANKLIILSMIVGIFAMSSCRQIFDEDLSGKPINIVNPSNKQHVTDADVTFTWHNLDGATEYIIKIVSPRFTDIEKTILNDTSITDNEDSQQSFVYTFTEIGEYEWKIYAINSGSISLEETRILFVDELGDTTSIDTIDTVVIDTIAPNAPIIDTSFPDTNSARLIWINDQVSDHDYNKVDVALDSLFSSFTNYVANSTNYEVTNLTSDTTYFWRVLSVDTAGNESDYSDIASFITN